MDSRPALDAGSTPPAIRRGSIGDRVRARKIGYWAAWVVPAGAPIILLTADAQDAAEARRQLLTVGLDHVAGWIAGGFDGVDAPRACRSRTTPLLAAAELRRRRCSAPLTHDRRRAQPRANGHAITSPGALHIPLQELPSRLEAIPRRRPIATMCEGGSRSALAASLLERAGVEDVMNVAGGMAAWRAIESPAV